MWWDPQFWNIFKSNFSSYWSGLKVTKYLKYMAHMKISLNDEIC